MSKGAQTKLIGAKFFSYPSSYVKAMYGQYKAWVFDEEEAPFIKGAWREKVFKKPLAIPLDLEIGPGSGDFLHHISQLNKNRLYLSIELKYKPLIQSARKLKKSACHNAKLIRYNACLLQDLFALKELNNVYIYFPDPWPKKRHHKHRLIKPLFVKNLYLIQKSQSFVEIKTDHHSYFEEIREVFKQSAYQEQVILKDLHSQGTKAKPLNQQRQDFKLSATNPSFDNFITFFEKIFINQNHPICYARYIKPAKKG